MSLKSFIFLTFLGFVSINSAPVDDNPFLLHELVPDLLSSPPESILKVSFPNGIEAELGNELTISEVSAVPTLEWDFNPDSYYTLVFCDPDAPSRAEPEARSYLHWLVGNIPGDDVTSGETLASILYSGPPLGSGLHRYLFVVYEQSSLIDFTDISDYNSESRGSFSLEDFTTKYNLGTAVAGNFYQTQRLEESK